MNLPWFKRFGIFFLPANLVGWILMLAGIIYSVYAFIDIDSRSHSASDTLMNFAFQLFIIGAAYSFIAWMTSKKA